MSVDLGSEWMKIAIVSPGVPMEIVLNRESKRKTPVAISFRNEDREIGEAALGLSVRFPEFVHTNLLDLLGKKFDNPVIEMYNKRFPHHHLTPDPDCDNIVFERRDNILFSVEELVSMILERAKELAEDFANQKIKDAVITVPAFFNQAERRAVLRAAELANVKVLQLINDNAAVALNYGVFRRKDFNATSQYIMFYDMGASSTKATIVGYQVVKTKEKGFVETNPQLTVLGYGFDRTLGGTEFTLRLKNHLAKAFNEQKKSKNDVFQSPRALSKLHKEAERVKMVLSANNDHPAQVENLLDDIDFKVPVQRTEFEEMCSDLFERVGGPIEMALKHASMTMNDIDQVILVGAGTRIPKLQEKLLEVTKKEELGKNINTDEAAALGAVYQAAYLSQGFKVKKFLIKEAVLYPIQVDFEREVDPEDTSAATKIVTRTLFGYMNPYPLKKVMTLNRITKNEFQFSVNYGELKLSPEDKKVFGSTNISRVQLAGMQDATNKHTTDESEAKGVKAHFRMDESGILTLDMVESVFELKEAVEPEIDLESAFSKLGSTISKLFSGGADTTDEDLLNKTEEDTKEGEVPAKEDDMPVHANDSETTNKTAEATENEKSTNQTEEQNNATATNATADANNATKQADKKSKIVSVKEPIVVKHELVDINEPSSEQLQKRKKRIEKLNNAERKKKDKEESKNNLEAFILETQDKLFQHEYEVASTEEEREKIRTQMSSLSDWLYEEGEEADAELYREKLKALHILTKDLFDRVREHRDRPEALKSLRELLNVSELFLEKSKQLPEEEQYYTSVELETLEKIINDTNAWKDQKEEEQEKNSLTVKPLLTIRSIVEKISHLDREVKYLLNKARMNKSKPKKTSDSNKTSDSGSQSDTNQTTSEDDSNNATAQPDSNQEETQNADQSNQEEIDTEAPKDSNDAETQADTATKPEEKLHTEL